MFVHVGQCCRYVSVCQAWLGVSSLSEKGVSLQFCTCHHPVVCSLFSCCPVLGSYQSSASLWQRLFTRTLILNSVRMEPITTRLFHSGLAQYTLLVPSPSSDFQSQVLCTQVQ